MDKLDEIFKMQQDLNSRVFVDNILDISYENLLKCGDRLKNDEATEADKKIIQRWAQDYFRAIQQECAEGIDSTNWKWWRTKVDKFDYQNLKVEVIDIIHFVVSLCQILGMTPEDVHRIYQQKNAINHTRQDFNYLFKDENDCKGIK